MPDECVCFGVPGSGKTTASIMLCQDWFTTLSGEEVAYLAFTKAAAKEAVGRILEDDTISNERAREVAPYFRTIHSLCYMGLRRARQDVRLVTTADMKQFGRQVGWEGVFGVHEWEDLAEVYQKMRDRGRTDWDRALAAYTLSRLTASSEEGLQGARVRMSPLANETIGFLEVDQYRTFVEKYEAFKSKEGLIDFTDMVAFGLTGMAPLDHIRKVIVDEAQDLCPLHHALLSRIFGNSEVIWWVGDDDQALYKWSGASAELFLDRVAHASTRFHLRQTRRFGQNIVDFSQRIIRRVSMREPKETVGVAGRAGAPFRKGVFTPSAQPMFLLHRHVQGCQALGALFMEQGVPFTNERGKDPLSSVNRVRSWRSLHALASGARAPWGGVRVLLEDEMPAMTVRDAEGGRSEKLRLIVHGAKRRLQEANPGDVNLSELLHMKILTDDGARVIRERRHDIFRHTDDFDYYHRVTKNGYALDAQNAPVITTIHGSKGRQAPHVVVFTEMSRKCWDDRDSEHRLAYVAATRTEGSVDVCDESLVDWAATAYDYPVEETA